MPHKPIDKIVKDLPEWITRMADPCLRSTTVEALVARDVAKRAGALDHVASKSAKALRAGDATLDQVAAHPEDKRSCRRAATALRKYVRATYEAPRGSQHADELGATPPRSKKRVRR